MEYLTLGKAGRLCSVRALRNTVPLPPAIRQMLKKAGKAFAEVE